MKSVETSKRLALIRKYIEYRIEFGDLQEIFDFLRQVEQLQVAALILHRGEPADQLADSRAVDIVHVSEVQQNHFPLISQQSTNRCSQQSAAVAKDDSPPQIHTGAFPAF